MWVLEVQAYLMYSTAGLSLMLSRTCSIRDISHKNAATASDSRCSWALVAVPLFLLMLLSAIVYRVLPSASFTKSGFHRSGVNLGGKVGNPFASPAVTFAAPRPLSIMTKYRKPIVIPAREKHTATVIMLHGIKPLSCSLSCLPPPPSQPCYPPDAIHPHSPLPCFTASNV